MLIFLDDCDKAFIVNDVVNLKFLFAVYPHLYEVVLPYVENNAIHDVMSKAVDQGRALGNDCFVRLSNEMNDNLNNCKQTCAPVVNRPLLELSLLL